MRSSLAAIADSTGDIFWSTSMGGLFEPDLVFEYDEVYINKPKTPKNVDRWICVKMPDAIFPVLFDFLGDEKN